MYIDVCVCARIRNNIPRITHLCSDLARDSKDIVGEILAYAGSLHKGCAKTPFEVNARRNECIVYGKACQQK